MQKHLIFCHGFGFTKDYWSDLSEKFVDAEQSFLDLGYFNNPQLEPQHDTKGKINIGIGHSLGFTKLLKLDVKFDYLIGLNSFINFLGNDPSLHTQRKTELESLIYGFERAPKLTLKKFYKRCGYEHEHNYLDQLQYDTAIQDLHLLFEKQDFCKNQHVPTLIIGSDDDIITPALLIEDNFKMCTNVEIQILNHGRHALGSTELNVISQKIYEFIYEYHKTKN